MTKTSPETKSEEAAAAPWFAFYMVRKGEDPIVDTPTRYLCTTCGLSRRSILIGPGGEVRATGWKPLPQHIWNRKHVHCTSCGAPITARTRVFEGEEFSIEDTTP